MQNVNTVAVLITLFIMAIPLVAAVYMAMKPGRSVFQAYVATAYVIILCVAWVFLMLWTQMVVVPRWFS